jgi:TolB-like protein
VGLIRGEGRCGNSGSSSLALSQIVNSLVGKIWFCLLLALVQSSAGICQETERERLAILPFTTEGLSPEQGIQLRQSFAEALVETRHFNILPLVAMKSILDDAGVKKIDDCTTLPCLAQLGKILGVDKVTSVTVAHQGEAFALHIQLVDASDASLLYNQTVDYPGTYNDLVSVVMPEQGRKLGTTEFGTGIRWYVVAAAVIAGAGIIYWIYSTFASTSSTQSQSTVPITSPQ